MTTLDKIKAEIQKVLDVEGYSENARVQALALFWVLELIDKYAEQEPCDVVSIEAVIEWLKDKDIIKMSTQEETARKELKAFLSVRPQPCEDAVSRRAVLEIAKSHTLTDDYWALQNLPSVNPQPKTGHWKRISMDRYTTHAQYWYECDKCGEHNLGNTDFCPYCGCRMVDPQESEVRND